MEQNLIIAIDGPAGAGKSTISRLLAEKLGYQYLDTGAMYRAVTWLAIEKNIDLSDNTSLSELAESADIYFSTGENDKRNHIYINNKDVTGLIRESIIDNHVSYVARVKGVRKAMVKKQRRLAEKGGIIVDGRDIGSRVLPDADIKLYITASLDERAKRRYEEIKDPSLTYQQIKKEINKRDKIDKHRSESPLRKTEDAITVDTTDLDIKEVLDKVIKIVKRDG